MFEPIVALATAPIKSALAIIRMSGDGCFDIVSKVFSKSLDTSKSKNISFGYIIENNKPIDQVVVLSYVAPHSFTGEDSVEIISHGSPLIADQIIQLILKNGARLAVNGEFSSRAYLNKKIDLVQAEAINDLINATTAEAKEFSMLSLEGKTSKIFRPIKEKIGELLSQIEVNIDYPEYEDIEEITKEQIIKICTEIVANTEDFIKDAEKAKIYHDGLNIAIVGKPNVGKSSLLNALIGQEKAIVTEIAGTTRDVVEGSFNLDGVPCHLFDTAGVHRSSNIIEKMGIDKTFYTIENADLVLYVLDDDNLDQQLLETIKDKKYIVVTNKSDLLNKKDEGKIYTSAKNNDVKQLLNKIKETMNIGEATIKPSFNNVRQLGLLKTIVNSLEIAIKDAKDNQPVDLISTSIMVAYNASLDLIGENNKNDLTDEIFSRFCVGK